MTHANINEQRWFYLVIVAFCLLDFIGELVTNLGLVVFQYEYSKDIAFGKTFNDLISHMFLGILYIWFIFVQKGGEGAAKV